jgi:hypothetical protein
MGIDFGSSNALQMRLQNICQRMKNMESFKEFLNNIEIENNFVELLNRSIIFRTKKTND